MARALCAAALSRAVSIVTFLTANPLRAFRISELASHLGMNIVSAHATLAVLEDAGFVVRDPVHRTYCAAARSRKLVTEMSGTSDPLEQLGKSVARRFRLVCLDEFHVADITDAMILHRLLEALFANRVSIVTTSNFPPDGLYPNGLHRERLLPAIELLKDKLEIVSVDGPTDYRQATLQAVELYHSPLGPEADRAMTKAFERLAEARDESPILKIEHREIRARRRAGGVVWFDFRQLCGGPRSQNDYLELATQFHTLLLSGVPQMSPRLASEARRFTWLIDVLYDRRVKLIMSAEVEPEALYTEGPLVHEFPRTVSRLREMRSAEFLAEARRSVDTSLT